MSEQYPYSQVPVSSPTSTTAIISLVAGILGLTFLPLIGSVIAVITGPMAKREIRDSGSALSGEGLATAGIILGWIGIGLAVLGVCVFGSLILIPLCLATIGISSYESGWLVPAILSFV